MTIEFRCTQCNTLLRTPGGTAGRSAQCPQCGVLAAIPDRPVQSGSQGVSPGPSGAEPLRAAEAVTPGPPEPGTVLPGKRACPFCAEQIAASAIKCKHCTSMLTGGHNAAGHDSSKRLAAGILAILLGSLGIHKFVMGLNTAGMIMLLVSVLTCGIGATVMAVVGIVEGIIYLTKTEEEFYQIYMVEQKEWF